MSQLRVVADLMAIAARTAPKATGKDYVVVCTLEGAQLKALGDEMARYGEKTGKKNFDRDGRNVAASDAVVLIGIKDAEKAGLDCDACGADKCEMLDVNRSEGEYRGPQCAFRLIDLGIALGSAVKTASILNVDNRMMYRAGAVARLMGLIDADVAVAIPLSATGKSPYFDR